MAVPEVANYTLKSIHQYNCCRMIEYIMYMYCAKPEDIFKFVHNRYFDRLITRFDCDYFGLLMGILKLI